MTATHLHLLRRFFKQTFLLGLVISLSVYAWVRLIFFEIPFSPMEDLMTLTKVIMTGWIMMIVLKGTYHLIIAAILLWRSRESGVRSREARVRNIQPEVGSLEALVGA